MSAVAPGEGNRHKRRLLEDPRRPMNPHSIDFASLLCSRLCHDLLSPVGALNNGLELLADEDDPAMRARCMELLADSARASADKLKFFRLAFGAAGGSGASIAASEVRQAIEGLVRGNAKVALGWLVDTDSLSRSEARLLLNLVLIAFDALVRGGRLDLGVEQGDVVVRAEGARLVLDGEVRGMLDGSETTPSSRSIGAALIHTLAQEEGRQLQLAESPGMLLLGASRPGGAPA